MRPSAAHCLLLSLGASLALAEEPAPALIPAAQPSITQATAELERRLVETERQRDELVSRMRQENRQLREQLQSGCRRSGNRRCSRKSRPGMSPAPPRPCSRSSSVPWSRGRRRQRREWIN